MPNRDYEEFLAALNDREVRYLVIGAHAVAFHAIPRATKDLDLLLDPSPANAQRVLTALRDFFGTDLGYTVSDLQRAKAAARPAKRPKRRPLKRD